MPLDAQLAEVLQLFALMPQIYQGTPEEARAGFRAMTCDLVTPEMRVPVGGVSELLVPGAEGDLPARLYRPAGDGPWPTLAYFHGGGWVIGDLDTHDQTCRRICADAEVAVLSVDYRLAPEHPFPAAVEDALSVVSWADAHKDGLGGGERLAVGGDSAGGNLAAVVAQAHAGLLDAQVLIYPATDKAGDYPSYAENGEGYFLDIPTMGWFLGCYVGDWPNLEDPRLSPIHGQVAGGPAALVVTAEFDPLRDQGEAYAAKLAAAGVRVDAVRYDGLIHGFVDMGEASAACAEAVADLNARIRALLHH